MLDPDILDSRKEEFDQDVLNSSDNDSSDGEFNVDEEKNQMTRFLLLVFL